MGKSQGETGFKFEWERAVADCRLGAATKSVAMWLSHHANHKGTNSHPGIQRLVHETELSERTVRRCLEQLREIGLIVRTIKGSTAAKRKFADRYDLVIPDDLHTHVRVEPKPVKEQTGHGRGGVANHVRWHEQRGKFVPTCIHCAEAQAAAVAAGGHLVSVRSPDGSRAEEQPESGRVRPPAKRTPTTGQTDRDHRSVEQYQQAFTNKDLSQQSAHPSAGPRASSRAAHDEGYRAFVARERAARTCPGEVLTEEDEMELMEEIDYDYVVHAVGDLDAVEESTARGMLFNMHPRAVVNEIRRMRGEAA